MKDRPDRRSRRISIKTPAFPVHSLRPGTVRRIPGHKCELSLSDNLVHFLVSEGLFVNFRRRFRKWLTVSPENPYSKMRIKSSAQMEREAMRHWTNHYYMIHPFSQARFAWEMTMIPVLMLYFIFNPMEVSAAFSTPYRLCIRILLDVLSVVDITLWFFTGYFEADKSKVVLDWRLVAKRYVVRYFFWDVLSTIPIVEIQYFTHRADLYPLRVFLLFKIVRMSTLTEYLTKLCQRIHWGNNSIKLVNFFLWWYALVMWTTCSIYVLTNSQMFRSAKHEDASLYRLLGPMIIYLYDVIMAVLEVGVGELQNISTWKMISDIVALGLGSVLNMMILAKMTQLFQRRSSTKSKYTAFLAEIGEYMKFKELPTTVKQRVFKYVNFKFQKNIFKEDDILNTISSVLKQDILGYACQRMIEKVDLFKDFPTHVMLRIVTKLKSEIYLRGDVIVIAGSTGNAMYFIYTGTVAVYTSTGKEICHLEDGEHFGEIAFVINAPRVATVVAVKDCEVFKLSRKDFQEAIEPFPELSERIRLLAMLRLQTTIKITEQQPQSSNLPA